LSVDILHMSGDGETCENHAGVCCIDRLSIHPSLKCHIRIDCRNVEMSDVGKVVESIHSRSSHAARGASEEE